MILVLPESVEKTTPFPSPWDLRNKVVIKGKGKFAECLMYRKKDMI